ncbi:hypothetical protein ACYSUO_25710 [Streptomyces sp. UC4497]
MEIASTHYEELREMWKWQGGVSVLLEYAADLIEGNPTPVTPEYVAQKIRETLEGVK